MKNSRDLILGEVVYIFIIYHILIRDFLYRMVTIFRFDHMIGENQQFNLSSEEMFFLAYFEKQILIEFNHVLPVKRQWINM